VNNATKQKKGSGHHACLLFLFRNSLPQALQNARFFMAAC
jgi:hypothetical protein